VGVAVHVLVAAAFVFKVIVVMGSNVVIDKVIVRCYCCYYWKCCYCYCGGCGGCCGCCC